MLVNNFKSLIQFGNSFTFKNVAGEDVEKSTILSHYTYVTTTNGHSNTGHACYNYGMTTATNNYTNEQSKSVWKNIVQQEITKADVNGECGFVLFVGSGLTTPTAEDYKLENALTLNVLGASCRHDDNITTTMRTFQNTTSENVTINELGLYLFKTTSSSDSKNLIMIARKLLEAPVTLAPNETYTFTYQIKFEDFKFTEE